MSWLVTTVEVDPQKFGSVPYYETVEIDTHPKEYIEECGHNVAIVFAMELLKKNIEEKTAPVQGFGRIPWSLHLEAWKAYASKYGRSQSAERIADRHGFHVDELDEFVPNWRNRLKEESKGQ